MTNRAKAAARRRRRINAVMTVFTTALLLSCAVAFAYAMKQADEPQEPSEEYQMYIESRDKAWFQMAEANGGEDPLESEHIEQAILELSERRYPLTTDELYLVCGVVEKEAGGEPYEGKLAVAQCYLNQCEYENARPADVAWKFAKPAATFSDETWQAVTAVFYEGITAVDDQILYFYNPDICRSDWHESLRFAAEIGNHRFFGLKEGQ